MQDTQIESKAIEVALIGDAPAVKESDGWGDSDERLSIEDDIVVETSDT